jgi:hypothetical protein
MAVNKRTVCHAYFPLPVIIDIGCCDKCKRASFANLLLQQRGFCKCSMLNKSSTFARAMLSLYKSWSLVYRHSYY